MKNSMAAISNIVNAEKNKFRYYPNDSFKTKKKLSKKRHAISKRTACVMGVKQSLLRDCFVTPLRYVSRK